jgi:hypothetical protein
LNTIGLESIVLAIYSHVVSAKVCEKKHASPSFYAERKVSAAFQEQEL